MKILSRNFNFFKNTIITRAKKIFSFKPIELVRQPKEDVLELNLIPNTSGIKSNTFKKMLAPEFVVQNNRAESGARITTLIDKRTNKPVEAFIARIEEKEDTCERYCIMVKDKKGTMDINGEKYRSVGETFFYIDKKDNMIAPKMELTMINGELYERVLSYMSADGNKDFTGIGLRLHQLRVERMIQNGLGNVCIVADGNSFPYHYAMGYRLKPEFKPIENIQSVLSYLSGLNNKSAQENAKFISVGLIDGKQFISVSKSIENCLNDYYKTSKEAIDFSPNMYLDDVSIREWVDLVRKQPILF